MKKYTFRLFSLLAAFSLATMISCKNGENTTAKTEEKTVEKKQPLRVETPQPSPFSTVKQKVGLTDVTIEYSRPGIKGRKIFGDLVPFDKVWRTGANANTKVTFSTDFMIGETSVKAGTYALYTKPGKKNWEIMLYSDATNWGSPKKWDDSKVVAKTTVETLQMPMPVETFTITFDDITNKKAIIGMLWDNIYVGLPFTVPTDKAVMVSIENVMSKEPNERAYFDAAVYFLGENKDINKALTWIDKAVDMTKDKPRFWYLRQQSLIHAKAGKKETAIAAAKQSLALAEKAGNAGYVKMNKASLKEWGAM